MDWLGIIKGIFDTPVVTKLLDLIPNENERIRAKEELEKTLANAMIEASSDQRAINLKEAEHNSIFVAGWRPFIGWVCGVGVLWDIFLSPLITWIIAMIDPTITLPNLDTRMTFELVMAMLGIGGLRTFEKVYGIETKTVSTTNAAPETTATRPPRGLVPPRRRRAE